MKKVKILHISAAKTWRGGEQQIAYLIDEIAKDAHFESVLMAPNGSPLLAYGRTENIAAFGYSKKSSISIGTARQIAQTVNSHGVNIIHVHDSHAHTYAVMACTLFGCKAKIILTRRVPFSANKGWLSKWKYNHNSIQVIACISQYVANVLKPDIWDQSKIEVIYSGIDLDKFKNSKRENSRFRQDHLPTTKKYLVGIIAAMTEEKDHLTFVKMAKEIVKKRDDIKFVIVGKKGPTTNDVVDFIEINQLSNDIILAGFQSNIPDVLSGLDVFALTSKMEGLGTSILDAMTAGVPVLATDAGGISETVIDESTGLLSPVGDAISLAANLNKLLDDASLRDRLVRTAKDRLQIFSKDNMAQSYMKIYRQVNTKSM